MKTIFVLVLLGLALLYGMFRYATFDREEGYFDLESQNIQAVMCLDGDGNLIYHINIPEGINLDYFSEGFCESL